jgi:hypothetical protein
LRSAIIGDIVREMTMLWFYVGPGGCMERNHDLAELAGAIIWHGPIILPGPQFMIEW